MSRSKVRKAARNARIYERYLLGETSSQMAKDYEVNDSQIRKIWKREEARRRRMGLPVGVEWLREMAKQAWAAGMRVDA